MLDVLKLLMVLFLAFATCGAIIGAALVFISTVRVPLKDVSDND